MRQRGHSSFKEDGDEIAQRPRSPMLAGSERNQQERLNMETNSQHGTGEHSGGSPCSDDWREVSKEEWNAWVNEKGAEPLVNNCSEPPTLQAMLGGKVVAIAKLYDGSEYHGGRMPIYFLPNVVITDGSERSGETFGG
jgi:hypothetical protein